MESQKKLQKIRQTPANPKPLNVYHKYKVIISLLSTSDISMIFTIFLCNLQCNILQQTVAVYELYFAFCKSDADGLILS